MNNNYKFYLSGILLPVNPQKLTVKYKSNNKTETLINCGEINVLKTPGLTEMSMDILLPQQAYPFAQYENGFLPAQYYLRNLKDISEKNVPIYFKVLRADMKGMQLWDTFDFPCTMENYSYTEDADSGFDVTASLTLKEYRQYQKEFYKDEISSHTTRPVEEEKKKDIPSEQAPKSYTVQAGDSLWKICKSAYGDGAKWREVAEKNNIANPNLITPGQVIILA